MSNKRTITVKEVDGKTWQQPDTQKFYHTVVISEYPSEPIKFIQDKAKGAPAPEAGKQYTGSVYPSEKGLKFYPFTQRGGNRQPRDDAAIRAQWAIGQAVEITGRNFGVGDKELLPTVERTAKELYAMVDRVKGSTQQETPEVKVTPETNENDFQTKLGNSFDTDGNITEQIDLSEIPF